MEKDGTDTSERNLHIGQVISIELGLNTDNSVIESPVQVRIKII